MDLKINKKISLIRITIEIINKFLFIIAKYRKEKKIG
jgi:hypothetical protein